MLQTISRNVAADGHLLYSQVMESCGTGTNATDACQVELQY